MMTITPTEIKMKIWGLHQGHLSSQTRHDLVSFLFSYIG